jgi:hypothetical protein
MSTRNTRIDVEVNTQNAKNQLREIANEATRVNNQINNQRGSSTQSSSSQSSDSRSSSSQSSDSRSSSSQSSDSRSSSSQSSDSRSSSSQSSDSRAQDVISAISQMRQHSDKKAQDISRQFNDLRSANIREYEEYSKKHAAGQISDDEFANYKKGFFENQTQSFQDERDELSENQKTTNELIQELIDKQDAKTKAEVESSQRDSKEFKGEGILKKLFSKRSALMEARMNATSDAELKDINRQLNRVNKDISKKSGGSGSIADTITAGGQFTESVISGNAPQATLGLLSKAGPWGMAAAAVLAATAGGIFATNKREDAISGITSYRALGDRDVIGKSVIDTNISRYNMTPEEFINKRKELLLSSGKYQAGSVQNTLDAVRLEKGYGIDNVSGLSTNERQDKYAKSTSDNILEMLNVLGQIRDGSISAEDLTLANEKSQLMYRLQSSQVSRQETFDNKQVLGLMTAFEKLGGEGKDQRAGDFIEGTLGALREGGSQNMMMLKHQFALQAHPELADDPAAIARIIEEGTDPRYITSSLKGLKNMFGGNKQAEYFGFKEFFKGSGLTASMREKVMQLAGSEEGLKNIMGLGIDWNKKDFNQSEADKYAYDKTRLSDEMLAELKKATVDLLMSFKKWTAEPIDVNVRNKDKNLSGPGYGVLTNTVTGN